MKLKPDAKNYLFAAACLSLLIGLAGVAFAHLSARNLDRLLAEEQRTKQRPAD